MANSTQSKKTPTYTEAKARRLIEVYGAIMSIFFLIAWFQIMILHPLGKAGISMENMDPSEIVAIPMSLEHLTAYVSFPVVILMMYWLVKNPSTLMWNLLNLIKLTGVIFALFAASGKNLIHDWQHSVTAALYVSTLLATTAKETRTSNLLEEFPFNDLTDIIATSRLYTTLLCTIPFQVLSVLDHGLQIQRWPIPVLIGSTYGYIFGTLIGILVSYMANEKKKEKQ